MLRSAESGEELYNALKMASELHSLDSRSSASKPDQTSSTKFCESFAYFVDSF